MQYLEIKEIEFSETATLQLIEACSEISTLKSIPEGLGLNSRFLSSEENVDKLIDCINNQEDLKDIENITEAYIKMFHADYTAVPYRPMGLINEQHRG